MLTKVFTLKFDTSIDGFGTEELELFIRSHVVAKVSEKFYERGGELYLVIFILYQEGIENTKPKITKIKPKEDKRVDYRGNLSSDSERALYDKLRDWRKEIAGKEGVPVFMLFTNQLLVDVIRAKPTSKGKLSEIKGFGESKIAKYGDFLINFFEHVEKRT